MTLYIRMAAYAVFAGFAGYGVGSFDIATDTFSITVTEAVTLATQVGIGAAGFLATWKASRIAKAKGEET